MGEILYEDGEYYIIGTSKGYEVYRNGATAAVRCATISGPDAFKRAKAEIKRRLENR